jgi:primosomal protein N' (replication factor Y)
MYAIMLVLGTYASKDLILTYKIREGTSCLPGMLFSVPVKQHQESALVLRLRKNCPTGFQPRPLGAPVYPEPVMSRQALALLRWLGRHYVCPLNRAAALFLPPPVRAVKKKGWRLAGAFKEQEPSKHAALFEDPKEGALWKAFLQAAEEGLEESLIKKQFGLPGIQQINDWLREGCLEEFHEWKSKNRTQKCLILRLTAQGQDSDIMAKLQKRAPRQAALLAAAAQLQTQDGVLWAQLQEQGFQDKSQVKGLKDKGLITLEYREMRRNPLNNPIEGCLSKALEPAQQAALDRIIPQIQRQCFGEHLLFGVTGSGKTEVYLQAAAEALRQGRQVLYMVPEISLIPQLAAKAADWFGDDVAVLHSGLSDGERYDEWQRIAQGRANLVLGPRSALFAPFHDLGMIVIDEEHENTYKQNEPDPRYDARDAARILARAYRAVLVRGSATPDLGTFYRCRSGKVTLSDLPNRVQGRDMPPIRWIDMNREMREGRPYPVSQPLLDALQETLAKGEQAILLMNRRGFHTYILCRDCGQSIQCPRCSIALTFHRSSGRLKCHYCDYESRLPDRCPHCGSPSLQYMGTGTERVVDFIHQRLPEAKVLRMDLDSTRPTGSHTEILREFQSGRANILVGTQMVAKGFDFAKVTLAGILHIDGVLNLPDYQSSERAFQLMVQTAGRSGRGEWPGQVVVQTFFPQNPLFRAVEAYDYEGFYEHEATLRKALGYPPFTRLARIIVSGYDEAAVMQRIEALEQHCRQALGEEADRVTWLGPCKAPLERIKNRWRYHLIMVCPSLAPLRRGLAAARMLAANLGEEPRTILDMEPRSIL